jgi:hypothetical protein
MSYAQIVFNKIIPVERDPNSSDFSVYSQSELNVKLDNKVEQTDLEELKDIVIKDGDDLGGSDSGSISSGDTIITAINKLKNNKVEQTDLGQISQLGDPILNVSVSSGDTIVTAINKLQAQILELEDKVEALQDHHTTEAPV